MEPHTSIVSTFLGPIAADLFSGLLSLPPIKADAIVFLQGDRLDRAGKVIELYQKNFSDTVLVTGNNNRVQAEHDVYLAQITQHLVGTGIPQAALVVDDTSLTTKDQAHRTIAIAQEREWECLLVVTSPYHALRAYLAFVKASKDQSFKGLVVMQAANELPWNGMPSGKTVPALDILRLELEKINKYQAQGDIASIADGVSYFEKSNITLTKASCSDIPFLWYLRNRPESREWSKNTKEISWDEHVNWIMPILMGIENRYIFIIKHHGLPAGQLRLDVQGKNEAVISIALAKEYWGKGLASRTLALAQDKAQELAIDRIIAHIHEQNAASRHLFERMHFIFVKKDGVWREYHLTF